MLQRNIIRATWIVRLSNRALIGETEFTHEGAHIKRRSFEGVSLELWLTLIRELAEAR